MCGEQGIDPDQVAMEGGSPPRVRGTVAYVLSYSSSYGITPACAGNRHFVDYPIFGQKDHPRVCGEQFSSFRQA